MLIHILSKIKYILLYYVLGAKGILHDFLYSKYNHVELKDKSNYVAVVTGGARGIGKEIVRKLMQCNMHVVIGCRDVKKGESVIQELRDAGVRTGEASVIELDLKSLKSVKKFADTFLQRHKYLNLLVNNAGIMFVPYEETEDGVESHLAVNYLGHFLLSHLLLPALTKADRQFSENARIINVSSCAHEVSPRINFDDIYMKKNYIEQAAYSQSKMCQLMFTKYFNKYLRKLDTGIQVIAVHPGVVDTEIFNGTLVKMTAPWALHLFCKTPDQGATGVIYCCIEDELEKAGGKYYSNCTLQNCISYVDEVEEQERLYEISKKIVKDFLPKLE
ncbi:retinol dehydrogenase 12-like isoform X2 [Planococcus citri]|uniref:retinol dehydrogenase 12-like isoform X2 n=1 Tax=Planococcus citri TaxID=170843 RepID=UPI0031F8923A